MEITPEFTKYTNEDEILFSCYNLYSYLRTEKSNGQRIIKLRLVNYDRCFDFVNNEIVPNSDEQFNKYSSAINLNSRTFDV